MDTYLKGTLTACAASLLTIAVTTFFTSYSHVGANSDYIKNQAKPLLASLTQNQLETNENILLMKKDICLILEYQRGVKIPQC
tara:strand:+ start:131 stop:379 length:249 start_codon:yes stop_codon:yes gene_type:complete